jgi:hypothetical protein
MLMLALATAAVSLAAVTGYFLTLSITRPIAESV